LLQSGGAWDHPDPIAHLLAHAEARRLAQDYLRYFLGTPHVSSYLGLGNYLRYRSPGALPMPWGWKDPRNTYTLPLWLDLFPHAKIIHVMRHGVDVAQSLKARSQQLLREEQRRHARKKRWHLYWLRPKKIRHTINSLRCASLEEGLQLWGAYVERAHQHVQTLGSQAVELKFEDFLERPEEGLATLAQFCTLSASPAQLATL